MDFFSWAAKISPMSRPQRMRLVIFSVMMQKITSSLPLGLAIFFGEED